MIPIEVYTDVNTDYSDGPDDPDDFFLVMTVISWWKLSSDESYLVMKAI